MIAFTKVSPKFESWLLSILKTAAGPEEQFERPKTNAHFESNIPGLFIIGDLAGAPVIKLAMAQGVEVIDHISALPKPTSDAEEILDLVIVGAGAAGLNAALAAQEKGFRCLVLEKGKIANTIEDFPENKYVYAEPDSTPPKGKLWLDGATKETLVERWNTIVADNGLNIRTAEELHSLERNSSGVFTLQTSKGSHRCHRVILATGQRGNPRKLGVPGEDEEQVYHRLYSPTKYRDESILVVGGGNSAVEAAITLCKKNSVTLSYRKAEFSRIFKGNRQQLEEAIERGNLNVIFESNVVDLSDGLASLSLNDGSSKKLNFDHAFILIGAELPVKFLKKLGVKLENEWEGNLLTSFAATLACLVGLWLFGGSVSSTGIPGALLAIASFGFLILSGRAGNRYSWLGLSFLIWHTIYGAKVGVNSEFWPFNGWGYEFLSLGGRSWAFWYTVIYTTLMTVFGLAAVKRWGIDRRDSFQIWRFTSLILFQWIFFFLIPEFLFQWAVKYQVVGEALASDPTFADQAWRSYGIIYAWPLFFYTFFYNPHQIWIVWGVVLTFLLIPMLVLFHGKRYCSWICGCGGLAETFGDRWRHLAPKGKQTIELEKMGTWVLILATVVTLLILLKDIVTLFATPGDFGMQFYRIIVDVWLVGIIPVTLYPFLGGKVWCRYWCPLAKFMQFISAWYAKKGKSRFAIEANDKCIACGECSRYCQVGIDVMGYALKQERLDNLTSSCIGCGICVTVCPMETLSFSTKKTNPLPILN